jgi:hypothetical protein
MKNFILILSLLFSADAFAQPFSIDWHKISGGGGTSAGTNGTIVYTLSGTIGQHDASGPLTNNSYVLTGGFWSIYALQTPGAPSLSIILTNGSAMVYWPSPSVGFNLQVATNAGAAVWGTPAQTVTDNGIIRYILVTPPVGSAYYRLVY